MDFNDQYKHPKWQKKRLDKMNSVIDFYETEIPCCEWCHDNESQLHVHHIKYFNGRNIWEYKNDELLLLCDRCHKDIHQLMDDINGYIINISGMPDNLIELKKILFLLQDANPVDISHVVGATMLVCKIRSRWNKLNEFNKQFPNG